MARIQGTCVLAPHAMTGATAETIMQIVAPANQRVAVQKIILSTDGTNSANTPMTVVILRQTTAGTFTNTAVAPKKVNDPSGTGETIQTSYQTVITTPGSGEPTAGDTIEEFTMPVFGGYLEKPLPLLQEIMLPGGTRLGIKVTAGVAVNVGCTVYFEE